ncbi:MAG: Smr/MutS family protein [Weeksellaceae bacterium]
MIKFRKGQAVKAIDDDTRGVITKIEENKIWVENEHGFDEPYGFNELLPDIELEEEIEEEKERPKVVKKAKNPTFKKKKKKVSVKEEEKIFQEEISPEEEELKELVENNIAKNSEEFRQKLEEKYKKEIKVSKKTKGTFVLDLHYGNLETYSKQLPTKHILEKQLTAAIRGIEKAKRDGFKKIILVHGKGKGVLEAEVKKYLVMHCYNFYDANFNQYKLGATEVEL